MTFHFENKHKNAIKQFILWENYFLDTNHRDLGFFQWMLCELTFLLYVWMWRWCLSSHKHELHNGGFSLCYPELPLRWGLCEGEPIVLGDLPFVRTIKDEGSPWANPFVGPPEHKLMQPLYTPAKTFSPKHPSGQNQKQASSNQIQHEGKAWLPVPASNWQEKTFFML